MAKRIVINLTSKHGGAFTLQDLQGQEYFVLPGTLADFGIDLDAYNGAESGDEFLALVDGANLVGLQVVRNESIVQDFTYEVTTVFADRTKRPRLWELITGTGPDKLHDRTNIVNGALIITISTKSLPEALRLERMILEFAADRWRREMAPPQVFKRVVSTIRKSYPIDPSLIQEAQSLTDEPMDVFAASYGIETRPNRMALPPIAVDVQRLPAAKEERSPTTAAIDNPRTATASNPFDEASWVEADEPDPLREGYVLEELGNLIEVLRDGGGRQSSSELRQNLGLSDEVLRAVLDRAITEGKVIEGEEGLVQLL